MAKKKTEAEIKFLRDIQCQMVCGNGAGQKIEVHAINCPNWKCSFQMKFEPVKGESKR